jgi:hypothetical protein
MEAKPYFHLVFRPNIVLVSTVRRFTGEFYERVLVDRELASRLALATHELLENAVAYASEPETAIRIEIDNDLLNVQTWNRATQDNINGLRELMEEVSAAPDPVAFYYQLLEKNALREDGSGLGIARVRAECGMTLSYQIDNDRVCIRAVTQISGGIKP